MRNLMRQGAILVLIALGAFMLGTAYSRPGQEELEHVAFFNSELTAELDLPFSEIARVGDLIFLSGMVGLRPGTGELVPGGVEAEAHQTLENIRRMLRAAGADLQDVVKCTVMLDDIDEWASVNRIYTAFFGDHRPARSAFGADGLAMGAALEVECIAVARGSGVR